MTSLQEIPQQNVSRETKSNHSFRRCKHPNNGYYKIRAERKGRWAEKISRILLHLKGYQILATRYKTPVGEIDIIAKRHKTLALESLRVAQQRRIQKATSWFLSKNPKLAGLQVRFDIILVLPFRWNHLQNMWVIQNGD